MFSHSEQKDFGSFRKTFCGFFNTVLYLSIAAFWGEVKSFLIFLQNKRKVFGRLVNFFFAGLAKLSYLCSKDQMDENIFPAKFILFKSFLDTDPEIFGLLSKCLRRGCQNCILNVHWSDLRTFSRSGNRFFSKKHFWNKKVRSFVKTFPAGLSEQHFRCLLKHLEEIFSFLKSSSFLSSFLDVGGTPLGLLAKTFLEGYQNWLLRVPRSFSRKFFLKSILVF